MWSGLAGSRTHPLSSGVAGTIWIWREERWQDCSLPSPPCHVETPLGTWGSGAWCSGSAPEQRCSGLGWTSWLLRCVCTRLSRCAGECNLQQRETMVIDSWCKSMHVRWTQTWKAQREGRKGVKVLDTVVRI